MTTSERRDDGPDEPAALAAATGCFVWVWLPGASEPVVAGRVEATETTRDGPVLSFAYGRGYRDRPEAISLFDDELPLAAGTFDPTRPSRSDREPLLLASCLRDAAPDAWGRRVLNLRLGPDPDIDLSELTYLLGSGSDRVGALDFQHSARDYVPRTDHATLEQLLAFAELTEAGEPIPADLVAAAGHGTSIGGARPKALLVDADRHLIAKFASSTDDRPVVRAEALAMVLAAEVGIEVPAVRLVEVNGKDVLLVDRFDRPAGGGRTMMLSGLTLLGLSEHSARYASYPQLADKIIESFHGPTRALEQLYRRLVFNVVIGNNDDHLRNVAAFWDGTAPSLTPAYDLTPQPRSTPVSTQAIAVTDDGDRASQLWVARKAAPAFRITGTDADAIIDDIVTGVRAGYDDAADRAGLTAIERRTLLGREILNPYIFFETP